MEKFAAADVLYARLLTVLLTQAKGDGQTPKDETQRTGR